MRRHERHGHDDVIDNMPDAADVRPGVLTEQELPIVHLLPNTDCNAWDLMATATSPGVCKFCYRERNQVATSPEKAVQVVRAVSQSSRARRVVFTGGEPLMHDDGVVEAAAREAKDR